MLQEVWTILLVVSSLVAPSAGVLVHLNIVGFLLVIFLRGLSLLLRGGAIVPLRFPLWFSILKVLLLVVLHMVDSVTMGALKPLLFLHTHGNELLDVPLLGL